MHTYIHASTHTNIHTQSSVVAVFSLTLTSLKSSWIESSFDGSRATPVFRAIVKHYHAIFLEQETVIQDKRKGADTYIVRRWAGFRIRPGIIFALKGNDFNTTE